MSFTDDFAGRTRAERIALVQAVAREHGDELDEDTAARAVDLVTALALAERGGGQGLSVGELAPWVLADPPYSPGRWAPRPGEDT